MLQNAKFGKKEVDGEETWKENRIWKNKSEKWTDENCGYGDGKNG